MRLSFKCAVVFLLTVSITCNPISQEESYEDSLHLLKKIEGHISPKSIVASGKGLFFAQNMMYRHTITVYDQSFNLVKTIRDRVRLKDYGYTEHPNEYRGSPVECAFSHGGKFAWVSNYNMSGGDSTEFIHPGCDGCYSSKKYDSSYVYKINTETFDIENAVLVGSVPKYLAVSPNNKYLLVSNWSSGDVSIVDLEREKEIKRIAIGAFPRGIAIDSKSKYAYIAVMGKEELARISLDDFTKDCIEEVGDGPRHLCIDHSDSWLYISLNSEGKLAKLNLATNEVTKHRVGRLPRSMVLSKDDKYLYVVNYADDQVAKVDARTMQVVEKEKTADKPIGITVDTATNNIWVSCYSGKIMVYGDSAYCNADVDLKNKDTLIVSSPIEIRQDHAFTKRRELENRLHENKQKENNVEENKNVHLQRENQIDIPPAIDKVEPLEKTEEVHFISPKTEETSYYIVAGGFSNKENAQKQLTVFKKEYPDAFIYFNQDKSLSYVCLNQYTDKDRAYKISKEVKLNGVSNWVYKKQ